jgi:hypothetical protein
LQTKARVNRHRDKLRCTSSEKEVKCRRICGERMKSVISSRMKKNEKTTERSEIFCDFRYFTESQETNWQKSLVLNHA